MKLTLLALACASIVAATPHPWAAQASVVASHKGNKTHKHTHHEPTPVFKEPCECLKPVIPENLLSANEKCLMEHAADLGCYMASNGGCPSPAPACGLGVRKAIPLTH